MGGVRKIDSETAPKTKNPVSLQIFDSESGSSSVPISAMLLHTFYIHHTIHTESGSGFSQKFKSGSEKCSRTPDPIRSESGSVPISGRLPTLDCGFNAERQTGKP